MQTPNLKIESLRFKNLIKLRFSNSKLEEAYQHSQLSTDLFQFRIAWILVIFLLLGDAGFEYLLYPHASSAGNFWRVFILIPMIVILIGLSFLNFQRSIFTLFSIISATIVGSILIYTLYLYEKCGSNGILSYVGWLNLFFILLFSMVILGLRFKYAIVIALIGLIEFLAMLQYVGGYKFVEFIYNCYQALSVFLLCTLLGFVREFFFRRDYLLRNELRIAHEQSEHLLHNILPVKIADRLKNNPGVIADQFNDATVLFADIVSFTKFSEEKTPEALVEFLNRIFSDIDELVSAYGLEKIKTIGDAYMVASGIPEFQKDHAIRMADFALDLIKLVKGYEMGNGCALQIRIGMDSGPVVAGVIGKRKFIYDLWGDTVNTASRMESQGLPGEIQLTDRTYELLKKDYKIEKRGILDIKGKGPMNTYLLKGKDS